jgi:predicted TIM-barrel fold metal-dependent hydrolase
MQDPPAVASELTHAVETLGLKGVQLLTSLPGRELSDPAYEPFWTRAEELGTYLRRIYVDTIVFTPHQLSALIAVFGPDHVLLGTDYPFDMGEYDPVGHVLETPGLDAATQARIIGGNAARLFGMM